MFTRPVRRARIILISVSATAAGAGLAASLAHADSLRGAGPAKPEAVHIAAELSEAFRGAAATVKPSVVSIRAQRAAAAAPASFPQGQGPLGEELFRQFFGPDMPPGLLREWRYQSGPQPTESEGSGLIIRDTGYIVTNNHVVTGARKLTVRLEDGRDLPAKVIGADPDTDLAVVRIDARGLAPATFGDSSQMQAGDWVVAVGSPFGLQESVTAGIVSAVGRTDVGVGTYENLIQTDTPINPGNSGGPLVNLEGRVIGINTAIRTASGGSNGIGFAIPASTVSSVADTLISKGHVDRGWLGVSIQPLTPDLAKSFNEPDATGVLISDVRPDTPAAKADLRDGDIVTMVNGKAVASPHELSDMIGAMAPGARVKLDILRHGDASAITITLGTRPGADELARGKTPEAGMSESMGLSLQPLNADLARQLGVPEDTTGLAVSDVSPDSPAARAGLRQGDVIVQAGKRGVATVGELRDAWNAAPKKAGLLLRVRRGQESMFTVMKHAG